MILIFAGAGASAAVSSKDYPTTVEFYNRLDKGIKALMDTAVDGSLKFVLRNACREQVRRCTLTARPVWVRPIVAAYRGDGIRT